MRYRNVEFRRAGTPDSNGYVPKDRKPEIVAWNYSESFDKETCYTLCWLETDKEGYYMKTIGDRYVEYEDMEALNHVAKYAMRILNLQFEFEELQYN
jgi:hypothetical protein